MDKKRIYHIIEWVVALAACAFLVWKLATYDDYPALWATLQSMGWTQWTAIAVCIALMPLNMTLEAWRWRSLMNGVRGDGLRVTGYGLRDTDDGGAGLSFREAQRQVYYSKLAGLITPWRLGEYPARALLIKSEGVNELADERVWSRVLSMGAVGSATMTAVIIVAGLAAMMIGDRLSVIGDSRFSYFTGLAVLMVLLGLALYLSPRLLSRWAVVSHKLVAISLGQSFVRLVCWCVQLALVLWALGAVTGYGLPVIAKTFVYYLLVTVTPNVPIAEVGVRGAWAIAVFGSMNAALAGVLLWVINTLLPCISWFFIRKKYKNKNIDKPF